MWPPEALWSQQSVTDVLVSMYTARTHEQYDRRGLCRIHSSKTAVQNVLPSAEGSHEPERDDVAAIFSAGFFHAEDSRRRSAGRVAEANCSRKDNFQT